MQTSRTGNPQNSGFTLLELVMVLVIIGIGVGLVVPRLSANLTRSDMRANIRGLSGAFSEARSRALLEGERWAVVIDLSRNRYWIGAVDTEDETDSFGSIDFGSADDLPKPSGPRKYLSGGVVFKQVHIKGKDEVRSGETMVVTQSLGLCEPVIVQLVDSDNIPFSLRIDSFDADVIVSDGLDEWEIDDDVDEFGEEKDPPFTEQVFIQREQKEADVIGLESDSSY